MGTRHVCKCNTPHANVSNVYDAGTGTRGAGSVIGYETRAAFMSGVMEQVGQRAPVVYRIASMFVKQQKCDANHCFPSGNESS